MAIILVLAMAAMVVENRDCKKWSSWWRCIFVFALRPAIFSLLFLFGRAWRIDSGDDCDGQAMVGAMSGPRRTGSVAEEAEFNPWCRCPSGVALLMLAAKSEESVGHGWLASLDS